MDGFGRAVIIGQGYVGLPVAMRAVEVGWDVIGYDVIDDKVAGLNAGQSPIEDVSDARLGDALASGRYRATNDPADLHGFDVAVISVPTPLTEGVPDLGHIEEACRSLAAGLVPGATVVLESTTYPGTTEEIAGPILEEGSGLVAGVSFHLGYSADHDYAAVVPRFLDAALAGRPAEVHGDGRQSRDFTYVGTVVRVVAEALATGTTADGPVNLAFGSRITLLELLAEIEGLLGHPVDRRHVTARPGDVRHSQADAGRLHELFPDVRTVPSSDGLARTLEWFRG